MPRPILQLRKISIHPPREGWDRMRVDIHSSPFYISIHPPREGWDMPYLLVIDAGLYFNPPTP